MERMRFGPWTIHQEGWNDMGKGRGEGASWLKKRGNMIDLFFQGLSPRTILIAIGKH